MRVDRLRGAALAGAGLLGGTGVAMAALAAHLGPSLLDARGQAILRQGVEMQMWHALALLGAGAALRRADLWSILAVGGLFVGTLAFCGGVYGLSLGGVDTGRLAPVGGSLLIGSWLLLGAVGWRGP